MSELTKLAEDYNLKTAKAFGWKNVAKKFVIGEREITIAETRYVPINSEMMLYASGMTWAGSTDAWLQEIPNDPYVHTGITLALTSTLMRLIEDRSYIINFYGYPGWSPLLNVIASAFGHPDHMVVKSLDDALPLFDNFPIFVEEIACEDPKKIKRILFTENNNKRIISVSAMPVAIVHKRILNIPLPDHPPVLIAPKNYGTFVEEFLKTAMVKTKFRPIPSGDSLATHLLGPIQLMKGFFPWDCNAIICDALKLKASKEGLIFDYINDNLENTYVVAGSRVTKALRLKAPNGPINVRYEVDTKRMFINLAAFRKYHGDEDLEEALKVYWEMGAIVAMRKKSLYGGKVVSARQYIATIEIDTTKLVGFDLTEFLYGVGIWTQSRD